MMFTVTVAVEATDKTHAKQLAEAAGFQVGRVAAKTTGKKTTGGVSPRDPFRRASAVTDMPTGLGKLEQEAYVRGYAKGAVSYTRKHGAPVHKATDGVVDVGELGRRTRSFEWDRHETCHKAAMRELNRWQQLWPNGVVRLAS